MKNLRKRSMKGFTKTQFFSKLVVTLSLIGAFFVISLLLVSTTLALHASANFFEEVAIEVNPELTQEKMDALQLDLDICFAELGSCQVENERLQTDLTIE